MRGACRRKTSLSDALNSGEDCWKRSVVEESGPKVEVVDEIFDLSGVLPVLLGGFGDVGRVGSKGGSDGGGSCVLSFETGREEDDGLIELAKADWSVVRHWLLVRSS